MTTAAFHELRDLVRHHGERRGWLTQRQIAVMCGLDESALSRFLNGEQDIGARRTHALFQTLGVPVEQYDTAYALLGRAQEQAGSARQARVRSVEVDLPMERSRRRPSAELYRFTRSPWPVAAGEPAITSDLPAAFAVARFASGRFTGEQIAAFFDQEIKAGGDRSWLGRS